MKYHTLHWRTSVIAFLCVCLGAISPASLAYDGDPLTYPTVNYGTGAKAAQIKRGEYLTKASDCVACHSEVGGKPFAGGLGLKTPFGTFYSPNITSDKEYGIGAWTDNQFVRYFKEGVLPDGSHTFPVFPYLYYSKMSVQDIKDIKAYLDVVPAVHKPNKEHDVPFPFNVRLGQLFWKALFFYPYKEDFKPDPKKSAEWNRGAYLVEGPGHCGMCHTPINLLGAPKRSKPYTGNIVDGYYAPNITGDNLKHASVDDVVRIFAQGLLPGGNTHVRGPMAQVNRDSLRYLTPQDLRAIAVYLKSLKSAVPIVAPGSASAKKIYASYCAGCHTAGAGGSPRLGDAVAWAERLAEGKEVVYSKAIKGYNGMPAKGNCMACTPDDIKKVVDYMLAQVGGSGGAVKKREGLGPAPKKLTLEDGQRVYEKACASCHTTGKLHAPKLGDVPAWRGRLQEGMDVLFTHTIKGYRNHPPRGACTACSDADIIAAVKYMAQNSQDQGKDYRLW